MSNTAADAVRDAEEKVRTWLVDLAGSYEVTGDGSMSFPFGSTRVFVRVAPFGDDAAIVEAYSVVLSGLQRSPQLYEKVAFESGAAVFGRLFLEPSNEDETVSLIFSDVILASYMDPEEFNEQIRVVAVYADQVDDEWQHQFGGARFHE